MTDAREAVLEQLAHAHDRLAERELLLAGQGKQIEAEGAHIIGLRLLRAWIAEDRDPEPPAAPPEAPVPVVNYWDWLRRMAGQ